MTTNRSSTEYRVGVGASSILMIFIVLGLTTLGVLSFASARADLTLTLKRQSQVVAYYAAESRAITLLSEIDEALLAAGDAQSQEEWASAVAALSALDPETITVSQEQQITLRLPVGTGQELEFILEALPPQEIADAENTAADSDARYRIVSQCLLNTADWTPDLTMDLASPAEP